MNGVPSALQMLQTLDASIPAMQDLIMSAAYLLGIIFIANALYKFRLIGDYRHMMSQPTDLKGPLGSLIVGAMLIYLPGIFSAATYTLWNQATGMMAYNPSGNSSEFQEIYNVSVDIMQLVGIIAFIRGWIILAKLGDHGQQGGIPKALAHIIGGVLAYHISATIYVFQATFGFT
jgi:intracellular multiplication protein IcmC